MTSAPKGKAVPRPDAARVAVKHEASTITPVARLKVEAGEVISGKFRLERPLGRGAMGSVWVARHLDLDIPVAVKLMLLDSHPDPNSSGSEAASQQERNTARARFEREAKAAAQLRSANIVRILDYGVYLNAPYMVMELLEGEDLAARLNREPTLPPSEVARILVPIARALQLAHDAGLVHRDLKPGNIFLAKEGDDEVPKILDFGIARSLNKEVDLAKSEATVDGMLVGTPSYMSPEQATGGGDIDHRSDLWSLGVVAFRALTGRKPFPGPGALDAVVQICTGPIPTPSDYVKGLPPEVDAFMARALQRDRGLRFQYAREMARALAAFLPRSHSSRPPPMGSGSSRTGSLSDGAPDPDSVGTTPGLPIEPRDSAVTGPNARDATSDSRSSKSPVPIVAGIALAIAVVAGVTWMATRRQSTPDQASAQQAPSAVVAASSSANTAPAPHATETAAVATTAAPSASSPPPAVSSATSSSSRTPPRTTAHPGKTGPTTPTGAPAPGPANTGRDLGY